MNAETVRLPTTPFVNDRITDVDEALIAQLGRDGRLGWLELGDACDTMPSTARRRVEWLMGRGLLRLRAWHR